MTVYHSTGVSECHRIMCSDFKLNARATGIHTRPQHTTLSIFDYLQSSIHLQPATLCYEYQNSHFTIPYIWNCQVVYIVTPTFAFRSPIPRLSSFKLLI
jgi:hypothetical protein